MRKGLVISGVVSLLLAGAMLGAACGGSTTTTTTGGGKLFIAGKDDFSYDPKALTAKAGSITVEFKNAGALMHTFTIDSPKVDIISAGGKTTSATFTATAGKLDFYCKEAGHKEGGMVGTLTVS